VNLPIPHLYRNVIFPHGTKPPVYIYRKTKAPRPTTLASFLMAGDYRKLQEKLFSTSLLKYSWENLPRWVRPSGKARFFHDDRPSGRQHLNQPMNEQRGMIKTVAPIERSGKKFNSWVNEEQRTIYHVGRTVMHLNIVVFVSIICFPISLTFPFRDGATTDGQAQANNSYVPHSSIYGKFSFKIEFLSLIFPRNLQKNKNFDENGMKNNGKCRAAVCH
jgi:hypothetical protein